MKRLFFAAAALVAALIPHVSVAGPVLPVLGIDPTGTIRALYVLDVTNGTFEPTGLTLDTATHAWSLGNATSATKLATARAINGIDFDGTAAITVPAAAGTLTGTALASNVVTSSITAFGTVTNGTWQATPIADAYIASAATWNAKISNITGLVTAGSGVSITGSGTSGSPYSIAATSSGGSVTSVGMTVPTGLVVSGQPITTSGTLALSWSGTMPCAQMPALTGPVTSSGASCATSISSSVNLAGSPTTTTQATGDNSTKIATTALVQAVIMARGGVSGFQSLVINVTSNSAISLTASSLTVTDGSSAPYRLSAVSLTASTATTGAGGLDTGTIAASTWYAVFVIYNPTTTTAALLLSTSATSPTLPSGYTTFARFGWVRTDGSSDLYRTIQHGRDAHYVVGTDPTSPLVVTSGAAGTQTALVAVAIGNFVPSTADTMLVNLISGSGIAAVAPSSAYTANGSSSDFATLHSTLSPTMQSIIPLEGTSIYYYGYSAASTVTAIGWKDNL